MLWDILTSVLVVLTLGAAFGAVPLSGLLRARMSSRLRKSPRIDGFRQQDESHAVERAEGQVEARVLQFPAVAPGKADPKDEVATQARRA